MGKLLAFQVLFPRLEEVQRADLNREKSQFSSVQFSRSVVSSSLHEVAKLLLVSNSCSSFPQSLPASGSFPMSQLFAWGGQSIGVSASTSVPPVNTQDWSPLGWTGWISLQPKELSSFLQHHSSKTPILWRSAFFMAQLSHLYMTTGKTIHLIWWTFVSKVISVLFNMLSRLVITFLPRSNCLLVLWLQSPSAVILEPRKIKSDSFHCLPIYFPWGDGTRCHDLSFLNVEF